MVFIETMTKEHDNTLYKWVNGECTETCLEC